jgi:hypothetical protein
MPVGSDSVALFQAGKNFSGARVALLAADTADVADATPAGNFHRAGPMAF